MSYVGAFDHSAALIVPSTVGGVVVATDVQPGPPDACATPGTANAKAATIATRRLLGRITPTLPPPTRVRRYEPPLELSRHREKTGRMGYEPYLPRLVRAWAGDPGARELEGPLVSVVLSGFPRLSERLQAKGRAGAEELVLAVSGSYEALIGITSR